MIKRLFLLLIFLVGFAFFTSQAHAESNFAASYKVNYTVNINGTTHAVFTISLKNKTDKYFASSYTLKVGFPTISNVKASDPNGGISPNIKRMEDGQEISLTFNKDALGKNASIPFTISFDTPDIATQNGSIWEVNIPGLANQNDFEDFEVSVGVPSSFGQPLFVKPDTGSKSLTFSKNQLGKSGISIAFGTKQTYAFSLNYHIRNNHLFPLKTEIALPPNTSYQHVSISDISPKPLSVREDQDGNWLAAYSLTPSQIMTVTVKGDTFQSLLPEQESLSEAEKTLYTKPVQYWQASDSHLQQLAKSLKTPYAIYQYVVKTLHYDFSRVSDSQERLGAVAVLNKPNSAVCLEFTDLFIALSRAAGIPAREIDGYAFTQNSKERPVALAKEILHAWPEYYDNDSQSWIMVDPTWQNTTGGIDYFHTFDLDHVAFVIKGIDSTTPIPAGGYKLSGQEAVKDITMTFEPDAVESVPQVSALISMSNTLSSGFPVSGNLVLENTGQTLFPPQEVIVKGSLPGEKTSLTTQPLPPFGKITLPFSLSKTSFLTRMPDTITIQVAGKTITKTVSISPFSFQYIGLIGGIFIAILCIIIFIIAAKPWRLFISRR